MSVEKETEKLLTRSPGELSEADLETLLSAGPSLHDAIGEVGGALARKRHGRRVSYIVNRNLNFTNICEVRCHFCAFYRTPAQGGTFVVSPLSAVHRLVDTPEISEVCIQGGINPDLSLAYYVLLIELIKSWRKDVHVHAFSPQEVWSLAEREERPLQEVLEVLKGAGLDSMPGTASEILVDEVRRKVAPRRLTSAQWEQVVKTAHRLGIRTSACMMFGHVESMRDRARHLGVIRRIQEETGGFTEFVPMPFMPGGTALQRMGWVRDETSVADVERMVAVSRLSLDDVIPNIQTSWPKLGLEAAAATLHMGANDIGGTLYEESITRSAGGTHGEYHSPDELRAAILGAGLEPVERDTIYQVRNGV